MQLAKQKAGASRGASAMSEHGTPKPRWLALVALGLGKRARSGSNPSATHGSCLDELGLVGFIAPKFTSPPEDLPDHCQVVQPTFNEIAFLREAHAPTAV